MSLTVRHYILFFLFFSISLITAKDLSDIEKRFDDALFLDNQNEKDLALESYKKIVSEAPKYSITYRHLVRTYIELMKEDEAVSFFNNLIKSDSTNGYAYYCLSRISSYRKNYDQAIIFLKKSIHFCPDYPEAYGYYFGLGKICQILEQTDKALKYYKKAISKPTDAKGTFYYSFYEILNIYFEKGDKTNLNKYLVLMKNYADKDNDPFFKAWVYCNLGYYKGILGEYRNALFYSLKSIEISFDPLVLGSSYANLAAIYNYLGENEKSLLYIKKQLVISEKNNLYFAKKKALINMGFILIENNQYNESLKYFKEIFDIAQNNNDNSFVLRSIQGMADSYFFLEKYDKARTYYYKALEKSKNVNNAFSKADVLVSLGKLYMSKNNYKKAIKYFKNSINICEEGKLRGKSEIGLGLAYFKIGNTEKAIVHFNNAISLFEKERKSISTNIIGDAFYKDRYIAYFYLIKLFVQEERYADAFNILEKYKTTASAAFINNEEINNVNKKIEDTHSRISDYYQNDSADTTKIFDLQEHLAGLELKKSYYQDSLNIDQSLLTLDNLKQTILGNKTALIQFFVGDKSTIIFAVKKDSVLYKEINISREELASLLHDISSMYRIKKSKELDFNPNILNTQMANFNVSSLYKAYEILIKPVDLFIKDSDELILVPDDLLYYLPFDALITQTNTRQGFNDFSKVRFLIEDFSISYVSSASILRKKTKINKQKPEYDLLAFGNPDFSQMEIKDTLSVNSKSYNRGLKNLLPLPYAQAEVNLIGEIVGPFFSKIFTNMQATEDNFKQYAKKSSILHLATHFMTNDQDPFYSKIALAKNKECKEDGLLQPFEISNMHLNADLAVLSACNTALGKIRKGEGLVGVSSAFRNAGVPSLLVSQWNVDDKATSLIMTSFYKYLKDGFTKDHALHQAKIDFLKSSEKEFKNPFYWAPFILIGNTDPVVFHNTSYLVYGIGFIVLLLLVFLWVLRKKLTISY